MPNYRRVYLENAYYFFTVALQDRKSTLLIDRIDLLRQSYQKVCQKYPFKTIAICILPDHIHAIWQLPEGDTNYSLRWQLIKKYFSSKLPISNTRSESKIKHREKGIWQRRFWEHTIVDDRDLNNCIDYIHYNPVRHGYVERCEDWKYSSIHKIKDT
ncbi:REP-associated tyrosine transposase [Rodentibacter haemolyticus]|uniref:Transposase n=1 Tax=Rodentibacter haemolyticus TaxID=2778911 RepID=A0ABX6UWS9_9PAST|nr:transposase [Rodentibacter haemolyticus]QPB42307.1 transposase [Rodentibacter haemolyticus]